ncbi:class II glutamine amidotransferase [Pilimelia terevasa]|uniref:Class II glutamine amidotransferase n=1 Tax=Pilimelia terevasa TaxID=53372 RepID=A0A8J3BVQ6_9ACTN|nr:class II glutamine amidotransferase [Pilimelia terevasa]GGK41897.1 class II glutamine amidotransferase [Pilimelia terevasa]
MCRWLAYSGSPIEPDELLYRPEHSLIDQALHSREGVETTNGDGFGLGWYDGRAGRPPAVLRGVGPAWSDANLREVALAVRSPLFLAHIRASTGTPVQQSNCHPFRHGPWLWMHNGAIRGFERLKRELVLGVDPALYAGIEGSTDSELMFYLALTFGLDDDPVAAVERMAGFVEAAGRAHEVAYPLQMTVATTNGRDIWIFRYSSEGRSRSLYYSADMATVRATYPEHARLGALSDETRVVVSEPVGALRGAWRPVPESSFGVVREGVDILGPFRPTPGMK